MASRSPTSASGSRSRSQGENSGLFHAPYVTPEGTHGRVSVSCGDGWQRVNSADEVKPWFLRDSPGFHLIPELNPLPSEAIFDKITMSAFEGTPLNIALRDCGIDAFAIVGIAMEIGIEPTVRHGADLGYIPVVVKDACGFGHRDAAARSIASLEFAGDALLTVAGSLSSRSHQGNGASTSSSIQ